MSNGGYMDRISSFCLFTQLLNSFSIIIQENGTRISCWADTDYWLLVTYMRVLIWDGWSWLMIVVHFTRPLSPLHLKYHWCWSTPPLRLVLIQIPLINLMWSMYASTGHGQLPRTIQLNAPIQYAHIFQQYSMQSTNYQHYHVHLLLIQMQCPVCSSNNRREGRPDFLLLFDISHQHQHYLCTVFAIRWSRVKW